MKKDLELFFERLLIDSEFRDKFLKAKSAKEGYELAKGYIPNVSFKEFKEGILITDEKMRKEKKILETMNDGDIFSTSGGSANKLIARWK